jgi:5-methyltetrahydropteroyltriglutamate--homocysteine methyltransferase
MRVAKLVGRDNVMAGLWVQSQALYRTEMYDTVVWEKFKAIREGADIASKKRWN